MPELTLDLSQIPSPRTVVRHINASITAGELIFCPRCGEEGHGYTNCWSYSTDEGDK